MAEESSGSGMQTMITAVLILVLAGMFFIYGLPALRNMGGTQINVPDSIDVNINQPSQ